MKYNSLSVLALPQPEIEISLYSRWWQVSHNNKKQIQTTAGLAIAMFRRKQMTSLRVVAATMWQPTLKNVSFFSSAGRGTELLSRNQRQIMPLTDKIKLLRNTIAAA